MRAYIHRQMYAYMCTYIIGLQRCIYIHTCTYTYYGTCICIDGCIYDVYIYIGGGSYINRIEHALSHINMRYTCMHIQRHEHIHFCVAHIIIHIYIYMNMNTYTACACTHTETHQQTCAKPIHSIPHTYM